MAPKSDTTERLCVAMASDLRLLATLQDREPARELLESLRLTPVGDWFALRLHTDRSLRAAEVLNEALAALSRPVSDAELDELAADYAAIHLVNTYRASPAESPWIDKEGLVRQGPMFATAAWYRRHGLAAVDRQRRPEDHLVLQLQFVAHLLEPEAGSPVHGGAAARASEAARFLDAHLLRWIGAFADRVVARCATPFHAGLVMLTDGYAEQCRYVLAELTGLARAAQAPDQTNSASKGDDVAERYVPGVAPSW
jgi:TorA maturation chaperone TorD